MISSALFYVFAATLLTSGVMTVSARNPVHAVLFLILCFFQAAGLFLLMGAEFLAFILLIVYVGAVAVLFLFVVMMLDINFKAMKKQFDRHMPIGLAVALILMAELIMAASAWVVAPHAVTTTETPSQSMIENTRALGQVLYTDYFYAFQVSGMILLVAMVGAITLTLRERKDSLRQKTSEQLYRPTSDIIEVRKIAPGQGADV